MDMTPISRSLLSESSKCFRAHEIDKTGQHTRNETDLQVIRSLRRRIRGRIGKTKPHHNVMMMVSEMRMVPDPVSNPIQFILSFWKKIKQECKAHPVGNPVGAKSAKKKTQLIPHRESNGKSHRTPTGSSYRKTRC